MQVGGGDGQPIGGASAAGLGGVGEQVARARGRDRIRLSARRPRPWGNWSRPTISTSQP